MYLYLLKRDRYFKYEDKVQQALAELELMKTFGDFNNEESIHRMMCYLFNNQKRSDINLLYFRLNADTFYVQSDIPINTNNVQECGLHVSLSQDNIYRELKSSDLIRIVTNLAPTTCKEKSKRSIGDSDKRIDWVIHKLKESGLDLIRVVETKKRLIKWNHTKKSYIKEGWVNSYTYDVLAKIEDIEKFNQTINSGIGRGKAYGCGLLLIKKLQ